jgi:Coenzyme PQQ synthesis protein D (PqqD)
MNKPKSRKNNLLVQDLEIETLVYDLKTNQAFCLNQTSSLVWQFCDGKNSIADISSLVSQKLHILASEDFVLLALKELQKNNLLESDSQVENLFAGFNRREIIKKVGFASMIALPIISSVIAPTAANAKSGIVCSTPCGASVPCCPGQTCQVIGVPTCCNNAQVCGNNCCSLGFSCVIGTSTCCPTRDYCQPINFCCGAGTVCTGSACCPVANVCGSICCRPGDSCVSGRCCTPGFPC